MAHQPNDGFWVPPWMTPEQIHFIKALKTKHFIWKDPPNVTSEAYLLENRAQQLIMAYYNSPESLLPLPLDAVKGLVNSKKYRIHFQQMIDYAKANITLEGVKCLCALATIIDVLRNMSQTQAPIESMGNEGLAGIPNNKEQQDSRARIFVVLPKMAQLLYRAFIIQLEYSQNAHDHMPYEWVVKCLRKYFSFHRHSDIKLVSDAVNLVVQCMPEIFSVHENHGRDMIKFNHINPQDGFRLLNKVQQYCIN